MNCSKCGAKVEYQNISNDVNNNINNKKTNTIAIVGFILSFLWALLGLIFSIIGLKKSKELNSGKCLSIAGIVISIIKLIFVTLIAVLMFVIGNTYDNVQDKYNDIENNNQSLGKILSSPKNNKNGDYVLDLSKYKKDDVIQYNLNDKYKVKIEIIDSSFYEDDEYRDLKIYINNKYLLDEFSYDLDTIIFSILDDYLIYMTYDLTNTHHNHLYIYNINELYNKIEELEKDAEGMGIDSYTIDNEKLIIYGSRISDSDNIEHPDFYENHNYCLLDKSIAIKATYVYKITDDLELKNLSKTVTMTLEDIINDWEISC